MWRATVQTGLCAVAHRKREKRTLEAAPGLEPGIHGFASRCLTNLATPPTDARL